MSSKIKNVSTFGIYRDRAALTEAVDAFKSAGFRQTDISILAPENLGSKDFAHEKHTKAPEGAVAGGSSGGVVGAALGWLLGTGAFLVPGMEAIATAGPLFGMLGGMGAGATLGGLTGALAGAGMPEYEAKRYGGRARTGGILISIHCDNAEWVKTARTILKRTGAIHVSSASEARADYAHSEKPLPRTRISSHSN